MNTLANFLLNASIDLIVKNAVVTTRKATTIEYTMQDGSTLTAGINNKRSFK